ncbi:mitochondrial transcription rescue factor 1-like isoform X2 [Lycorma delicatula]|uniref:mitochondrial transcription rescue factor 1-like isoform X2 n=1 Tax=Lycorma delicatula TaxID=130591 RepID=UPI003F518D9B
MILYQFCKKSTLFTEAVTRILRIENSRTVNFRNKYSLLCKPVSCYKCDVDFRNKPNCKFSTVLDICSSTDVTKTLFSVSQDSCRNYSKKKRRAEESDSESSDEDMDVIDKYDRTSKIIKTQLPSMRVDVVLKSALGLPRNKLELAFYESRIRLNGEKMLKKSQRANVGDEIDLIKGVSNLNPDFLNVARVEIISAKADEEEETIYVRMRRTKSLQIENYENNPFKLQESIALVKKWYESLEITELMCMMKNVQGGPR